MSNVVPLKALQKSPTGTVSDTILLTAETVASWKNPPFQRELRVNAKVLALAEKIKADSGVIPGIICLGVVGREMYLMDGQHRIKAWLLSEHEEGYCDIRTCHFDSMAAMGDEYVNLNSHLVALRPDDILRGLEASHPPLKIVKQRLEFVGYDQIRRGGNSPIVSMAMLLRCWFYAGAETPAKQGSCATKDLAEMLTHEEAEKIIIATRSLFEAWGKDPEYQRLWGALNLTMTFWLYRRVVLGEGSSSKSRATKFSRDHFQKAMNSLSADSGYLDWLVGRKLSDRDRPPCYRRLRNIIGARYRKETGKAPLFPQPAWAVASK